MHLGLLNKRFRSKVWVESPKPIENRKVSALGL